MQTITLLLGSEGTSYVTVETFSYTCIGALCTGSEKLIAALESAAPEKLLGEQVSAFY